jgi:hypothetical protein
MSGIKTIIESLSQELKVEDVIGQLDEVNHVVIGNSSFVHFNKKDSGCLTLTVQHWSEDVCDEIEVRRFSITS